MQRAPRKTSARWSSSGSAGYGGEWQGRQQVITMLDDYGVEKQILDPVNRAEQELSSSSQMNVARSDENGDMALAPSEPVMVSASESSADIGHETEYKETHSIFGEFMEVLDQR